jgi:Rrf2 family protein
MYGKQTELAIACMSRLAEVYDGGVTRLSAADIAKNRDLPRPFVAKVCSVLSQAGLLNGSPGPGGGYALDRHPREITLYDVFSLFEREDRGQQCPFGGGICGAGSPCPLHDKLVAIEATLGDLLHHTTFDVFRVAYQVEGRRPATSMPRAAGKKRESYRASGRRPRAAAR